MINHATPKSMVAYRLIKECGLRPVEVKRLAQKHFDLEQGIVYPEIAEGSETRTETDQTLKVLGIRKDEMTIVPFRQQVNDYGLGRRKA